MLDAFFIALIVNEYKTCKDFQRMKSKFPTYINRFNCILYLKTVKFVEEHLDYINKYFFIKSSV